MNSFFEELEPKPEDPILHLPILFAKDPKEKKVSLGIGTFKDEDLKPYLFSVVKEAEEILNKNVKAKNYLSIDGDRKYLELAIRLPLGESIDLERIHLTQTIGGSGAIHIGGELICNPSSKNVFIPRPSWSNHTAMFVKNGFNIHSYPYYDEENKRLAFDEMQESLKNAPKKSVVLIQVCCHNPTGCDLTKEQWMQISELMKEKELFPFFDCAYQGFGDDFEKDSFALKYFYEQNHEMSITYSFSKNMGLYGERIGFLAFVTKHKDRAKVIGSNIRKIIRGEYSTPSIHGAALVRTILEDKNLKNRWLAELSHVRSRILEMRLEFHRNLKEKLNSDRYDFLLKQKGMFSLLGLSSDQVKELQSTFGVYLPGNGRINMAALSSKVMDYVVSSLIQVI